MAANKDFIDILREIRGSGIPGEAYTDGIWYELTIADRNSNPGIYGDILSKYGIIVEHVDTFAQAVSILEKLNVEITTLPAGSEATSALVYGVWQLGIPIGTPGIDGLDGFTPNIAINYTLGKLNCVITVDNVQVVNTTLVNLDELVNTVVNANVDVQTTLEAKQLIIDSVEIVQEIADGLDDNVANKIVELSNHTIAKLDELNVASTAEQLEITNTANVEKLAFGQSVTTKVTQYNENHVAKLAEYDANDELKIEQYNINHTERLENLDEKYATRIIDMLNTNKILGMVDKFAATVPTQYATFMDTATGSYMYYLNGAILTEVVDYTVINATTIRMTTVLAYGDIVTQVDSQYIGDYLTFEGVILEERIGQPNGVAGLDETGKVPAAQLPGYVDDVVEVATKASLPAIGEIGKIYVVIADETSNGDTSSYRWTGSIYAMVSNTLNAADVKALYESNANTNAYTDAEKSRVAVGTVLQTVAQTLPSAINELDTRIDNIVDNTTLAEYGITDAYTKTEVQETLPAIGLDTTNTTTPTRVGQMRWNQNEGTVDLALQNGVTLQMGQENNRLVRNGTASPLANMTVCMFAGTIGNSGRILVAPFDGVFTHTNYIYGVATQSIAAGADGYITIEGKVRNVNTTGAAVGEVWADGDILYVKPNDAGHLTKVEPTDDELKIVIASVVHAHTNGTLEVRVLPFNENMIAKRADKWTTARTITLSGDVAGSASVDGSANVTITTTVQPNSVELGADTTGNYMVNVTAGSGISVSHTQGEGSTATITNSAPNVTTNITTTHTLTNVVVNSSDGTDGTINSATQTLAGVMSAADKVKLDGIEAGATGDQTASEILTLLKTVDGSGSGVDADLLDGQEGAYYRNASNINTGTINDSYLPDTITSSITGNAATATKLATPRTINGVSFDGTANITVNAVDSTARIASSEKGVANGVATLDGSGLVPSTQLPSYVDDVLEYSTFAGFPATGVAGKIYVDLATNKTYRWSGSAYVYITSGVVDSVAGKTGIVTLAKADVGLGNVDNTSDSSKNVLSATKWTTGRTITIGATGKTVDGSGNVSWSLAEIGAQASGNYQPLDATLTALAGVTTAADKVIYATGIDTFGTSTLSAFGRTLIDNADATTARATLGVVIGTNVQAYDAGLLSIAGLTTAADKMIYTTASDVYATATLTAAGRALIDDADAAAQRTTLGISATNTPSTAVGGISATNVQAAIAELDTEKVAKSVVVTAAITSVTFNADGTITIVTP